MKTCRWCGEPCVASLCATCVGLASQLEGGPVPLDLIGRNELPKKAPPKKDPFATFVPKDEDYDIRVCPPVTPRGSGETLYPDFHRIVVDTVAKEAPGVQVVTDFNARMRLAWFTCGDRKTGIECTDSDNRNLAYVVRTALHTLRLDLGTDAMGKR